MEVGKLTVQRRQGTGKGIARKLRATGFIPGVCYGAMLEAPIPIAVDARALASSLDPHKRHNTVIDMTIEGNGEPARTVVVMVKDYQFDRIRRDLSHVDLVAIDTEKDVVVEIPIELVGKPKGLVLGGQLHSVRHTLEVRCRPAAIPDKALVDVSHLDIGGVVHVSDVTFPEGVKSATPGHMAIVTCTAPVAEAAETAATPAEGEAVAAAPADKDKDKDKGKDAKSEG